ncbi:Homoserine kinase [Metallosphaera sp. J1]|uniref:homoserine kinase n=1 Tax=Metallosphaera javensis (ex Hofmann et al. 2022) TaxID=99938 RepID=UPI001EE089D2|nr:homoserine kinase [Metallosphaera javensis (ex Hofmann et al. 2022)]MCG3108438.1 Homoserine kinase [Metallosphaera javensis (ex Hofmann et al. 2022)]
MRSVKATAFSSSANLGAGYDILSMSHSAFSDIVYAEILNERERKVVIASNTGIPLDPARNSAGAPVEAILREFQLNYTVKLSVIKGVPPGLGLGSSGASAVAAAAAVNELFNLHLTLEDIVRFAVIGEKAVSGSPHPDNVAASAFGGIVAVTSHDPIRVVRVPINLDFKLMLVIPKVNTGEGKTKKARELVPRQVEVSKVVENTRFLSSFILGVVKGDRILVREGLNDNIVEKSREPMYPHYPKIKETALKYDAVGACVSGAGPTVLILYDNSTRLEEIRKESAQICAQHGFSCDFITTEIGEGVRVEGIN